MKPTILLYGNCQAQDIATIASAIPCLQGRVTFKSIAWYVGAGPDWDAAHGPDFMRDIGAVWEQVESGPIAEHRTALHRHLPAGCQIVRFPPLTMTALWPFVGSDPRQISSNRYFWTDSVAAALANSNLPDDELFATYMRLSTERMPDLERRLRLDLVRWRATDALSDIRLADYVLEHFRTTRLFYTMAHVSAVPLRHVLRSLIDLTDVINPSLAWEAKLEVDVILRHHRGQDFEMVPLHPIVAERLNLAYYDPDERHRYYGHAWTHKEYILNYIRWASYLGRARLSVL